MSLLVVYLFILYLVDSYWRPPSVIINLDNGENTWNDAIDTVLKLHGFNYSFGPLFEKQNKSLFNYIPISDYSIFCSTIKENWPNQYTELVGISNRFIYHGYYVSVEYLCGWAYYHELYHVQYVNNTKLSNIPNECTGILIRDKNDNIWQGRNHDPGQGWNITLSLSFYKNNQLIFEGRDYYWFATGVVTAFKSNILSVQENAKHDYYNYSTILNLIKSGRVPVTFLFREMLIKENITYHIGAEYVCNIPLSVPIYIIMGGLNGPNDGCIITKYPDNCILLTFNNITNSSNGNYGNYSIPWYMIQTNTDLWEPDIKRTYAENMLLSWDINTDLKNKVIGTNLMAVMSSYYIYSTWTVSTSIMSVTNNIFLGYVKLPLEQTCQQVINGNTSLYT